MPAMVGMKRPVAVLVAAVLVLLVAAPAVLASPVPPSTPAAAPSGEIDASRLLVTYEQPVGTQAAVASLQDSGIVPLDSDVELAAPASVSPATSAVQVFDFGDADTAAAAASSLADQPGVVSVEPDVLIRPAHHTGSVMPSSWWLQNDGAEKDGVEGRRGADIGAPHAWHEATGDGIVVAVIDTGVDISHPALRDRLWVNPGERRDGTDTDGNGFVDDLHGWNFAQDNGQLFVSAVADAHGTHVAGVIVGAPHEASGSAGAAPDARVMVLRFIDGDAGRTSDAIAAIRYAVMNGADVINASWGSAQPSNALRTVLQEIDLPVVVSAGNAGVAIEDEPIYPAAWDIDNVISVAATEHTGALAPFSTYSRDRVTVAAPGVRIAGPYPGGRYALASGTSQAAPLVSAILAMALERHPGLMGAELADAVRATVRPLSAAAETRSGGLARAPALLDHLGTRFPACSSGGEVAFSDVRAGSVHHDAVACMVAFEVTRGVTSTRYGSELGLTRAQVTTMVARALDRAARSPAVPEVARFTDVAEDSTHRDAIEALGAAGIVHGTSATTFSPSRTVTRAELAGVVARAAEYAAEGEVRAATASFVDLAGIDDTEAIDKAAWLRIVLGQPDGRFEPDEPVRRDQAASMVSRLLDRWVQQGILDAA